MLKSSKWIIGLTFAMLTLLVIPMVFAIVVPIGDTVQPAPFESNPTLVEAGSRSIATSGSAMDGDPATYMSTTFAAAVPRQWGLTGFERPSDLGLFDFDIGWVDLKVLFAAPAASTDDTYRWVYYVGALGPFPLVDPTSGQAGLVPLPATDILAQTWHARSDGGDGVWTWEELNSIVVRTEFVALTTVESRAFRVYEIWLSVYPLPTPPVSSTTLSMQPAIVPALDPYTNFFVDVYGMNMETPDTLKGLAGWEFTISFDPAVLFAVDFDGFFSYYPCTTMAWVTIDNTAGTISASYYIGTNVPSLVDVGLKGSYPIARIYFMVNDQTIQASGINFDVSILSGPAGINIPHTAHNGVYGAGVPEFPFGLTLLLAFAPLISIAYLWRTRSKKKVE